MPQMCAKRLKYFRNEYTVLEMTEKFEKRLSYVEMTYICVTWLKYLRNG